METQGTGAASASTGQDTVGTTTTIARGGRLKKKPPKSASSQFFSLLGQGASQVLLGRGPGGPRQTSPGTDDEESRHLLHLDDALSRSSSSSPLIGSEGGIARGHSVNGEDEEDEEHAGIEEEEEREEEMDEESVSTGTVNTTLYHSDAEEEEEEEEEMDDRDLGSKAKESAGEVAGHGYAGHRREESRAGPMSAPVTPQVRRARPKLLTSQGKAQSEFRVNDAEEEKARARAKKKRVVLVRKKPSEQETYNPKYFFLREYGSGSNSSSEEDEATQEDEFQHKGEQDKPSDDASPTTTTTTELSSHKQTARRKKNKQKRGISGGWVMKRVLVMMGKKDKMKALLTSNPKRKASLHTSSSFHELESSSETEGNDDIYEMMEVHSDDDVEVGETLEEKDREDQAVNFLIVHHYLYPLILDRNVTNLEARNCVGLCTNMELPYID